MQHETLTGWLAATRGKPVKGPVAVILAEDAVEVDSTLAHHLAAGFRTVLLLAADEIPVDAAVAAQVKRLSFDVYAEGAVTRAVNPVRAGRSSGLSDAPRQPGRDS